MKNMDKLQIIQIKNAIRLLFCGYLHDGGDVEDIVPILKELIKDYGDAIKKEIGM